MKPPVGRRDAFEDVSGGACTGLLNLGGSANSNLKPGRGRSGPRPASEFLGGGSRTLYTQVHMAVGGWGVGPRFMLHCFSLFGSLLRGCPVQRFKDWLVRARNSSDISRPCETGGRSRGLLPLHLPWFKVRGPQPRGGRRLRAWRAREAAVVAAEWLITWFNYHELGCPKSETDFRHGMGPYHVSEVQHLACERLVEQLARVTRCTAAEAWTRGRKTLLEAIQSLAAAGPFGNADPLNLPAQSVNPDRISVPKVAGISRPEDLLAPERAEVLKHYDQILLPKHRLPAELPNSCHWVAEGDEPTLRKRLFAAGMVVACPAAEVPSYGGRALTAGLFTVPHKQSSDRLIIDRRPANATERRLQWAHLPSGVQFGQIRIPPDCVLRGSGDDLSSFFYLLENPACWRSHCAIGRKFRAEDEPELNLVKGQWYYMALRVWGMGDHNAVDVAQLTHEDALDRHSALEHRALLRYGLPLPETGLYQGIYIDDHLIMGLAKKHLCRATEGSADWQLHQKSRKAYDALGWPRAVEKGFERALRFTAWGVEVDGQRGTAGAPVGRRLQLSALTILAVAQGTMTKAVGRSLLGSYIHPFGLRREFMSCFGRSFRWVSDLPERAARKIPHDIRQELLEASLLVLLAEADLRAPVSTHVYCSDATPHTAGLVEATVSRGMAGGLFDHADYKGKYTRLDWDSALVAPLEAWEGRSLPPDLLDAVRGARWVASPTVTFRTTAHVNLQEAKSTKLALKRAVARNCESERVVSGSDSQVLIGAWGRGRSSSSRLNKILQSCLGWAVLGQKKLKCFWLESAENPSDDPSRYVALRKQKELSGASERLILPEAQDLRDVAFCRRRRPGLVLEVFAGRGRLSQAIAAGGLPVDTPIEAYPVEGYIAQHDLLCEDVFLWLEKVCAAGQYDYVHFGFPPSSFSIIQQLNGGSRTEADPAGDGTQLSEVKGNLLAMRTSILCRRLHEAGKYFSIENPRSSFVWTYGPVEALLEVGFDVFFDQCEYNLRPPHWARLPGDQRIRKSTCVRTNMGRLESLSRKCSRQHTHFCCLGRVKVNGSSVSVAREAGCYPRPLVEAWSRLVGLELRGRLRPVSRPTAPEAAPRPPGPDREGPAAPPFP